MDSGNSKKDGPTTRSSARQSLKQVPLSSEAPKPRPPIKRTRKMREDAEDAARPVNGSKEPKSLAEDDGESPVKKQKPEDKTRGINEKGDGLDQTDEADVEMGENEDQDQERKSDEAAEEDQESSLQAQPVTEEMHPAYILKENLESKELLGSRRSIHPKTVETERPKPKSENYRPVTGGYGDPSSLDAVPLENRQENSRLRNRNNINYQNAITEKPKNSPGLVNWNRYPPSEPQKSYIRPITKHHITNQTINHKNAEFKKPVISKASPASSSKGWMWHICKLLRWPLILIVLLALGVFVFLAFQKFSNFHLPQTDVAQPKKMEKFDLELAALQDLFPSQHSELWKRSQKHLKNHLKTINPTEPVSVILTAGLQAEKTLGCLAQRLATAYSASLNASILEIEGATKRAEDSDQVKLYIDEALSEAFKGDIRAVVVHRFEELPPGSTLIFYRYCDHENASHKKVFLVFTVMLSRDKIDLKTSLKEVEDMVYDYIKQKFVTSDKSTRFNQMDVDKLSGLWSRISHLILPVAAVEKIEQQGCGA